MSTKSDNDVLQQLPAEKWPLLRDSLKVEWPKFAHFYYLVDNAIRWRDKDPTWLCEYYCPRGDHSAGVFLVISPLPVYNVIPFAFKDKESLLFDCLVSTKHIDWSRNVLLRSPHECFKDAVEKAACQLAKTKNLQVLDGVPMKNYIKFKEESMDIRIEVPEDMELRFFNDTTHARQIFDAWFHDEFQDDPEGSFVYISNMIRINGAVGLFTKSDSKLISWVCWNDWGGYGALHTVPEYRGRGFARIIVNALSRELAVRGYDSTTMILDDNVASRSLFTSLNFRAFGSSVTCVKFKPPVG